MSKEDEIAKKVMELQGDVNKDEETEKFLLSESGVRLSDVPLESPSKIPADGYYRINKSTMPFADNYPAHFQFEMRSATVNEIKHWSTLDNKTQDALEVMKFFNYMLEKCVRVVGGRWDDIKETDRFWFIASLHELTFVETERPQAIKCTCKDKNCDGHEWQTTLSKELLVYDKPDEKYYKYFNQQTGTYDIQTKSYGTIIINPPSIRTANALMAYISESKPNWVKENATFLDIASYLVPVGITPTTKVFETIYLKYKSWHEKEFAFMVNLVESIKVVQKQHFAVRCPKCNKITSQDFDLEGGIRGIFLPVSDIDNELL